MVTLFQAPGISALASASIANVNLRVGEPVVITMTLNQPVASAFNLAGAEAIFGAVMPPGLQLEDVRGVGSNTVEVHTVVVDTALAGQGGGYATMNVAPLLLAIVPFIAANWISLSFVTIGILGTAAFLVSAIRGDAPLNDAAGALGSLEGIIKWGLIAVIVMQLLPAIGGVTRKRNG